jgi:taurine dioxygenase
LPDVGGDTCFASMYAAFESLSPALQAFLRPLTCVHSMARDLARLKDMPNLNVRTADHGSIEAVHPVVRVHPETGRALLNVNSSKTIRVVELEPAESDALLAFLFEHVKTPELQCRFHWEPHSVAFWDNRAVQHYAVADYTQRRAMSRVLIAGDAPKGP